MMNGTRRSIAQYLQNPSLLSIEAQWNDHITSLKESTHRSTVFGLRFVKNQQYLVGCTSLGCLLVWTLPVQEQGMEVEDEEDHDTSRDIAHNGSPTLQFNLQGSPTLYTLELSKSNDDGKLFLLVGGDGGVYIVDWEQQVQPHLATASSKTSSNTSTTLILDLVPCQHLATHKNPWEGTSKNPEVNSVCYTDGYTWGAAGDAFGCYKWNTETGQAVATYAPVRKGATLYTVTTTRASTLCCIGGDHGTVEVWDSKADQRLEVLPPSPLERVMCSTLTSDDSWWTVGGAHGLATLHLPTRRWVPSSSSSSTTAQQPTEETIQDMTTTTTGSLITVGTEGVVSHWSRLSHHSEPPAQRVLCHASNGFAVTASTDDYVAVGGVGDTVDVFYATTVPYCQLSTSTTL